MYQYFIVFVFHFTISQFFFQQLFQLKIVRYIKFIFSIENIRIFI